MDNSNALPVRVRWRTKPDLLLLDEPFLISTLKRHDLIAEIRKIFKKQGVTQRIFVTHSREEAFAKMAVMNHGVISTQELYYISPLKQVRLQFFLMVGSWNSWNFEPQVRD